MGINLLLTAAATLLQVVTANANANGCVEENGNWYCNEVSAITYSGFGLPGTYEQVSSMANGQCGFQPFSFQGGMAPLDGEISWHFRGPMQLKQFAFYTPGSSSTEGKSKRENSPAPKYHQRRSAHGHAHNHFHDRAVEGAQQDELVKRGVGDWVTATIDGKAVSWVNNHGGVGAATPAPIPANGLDVGAGNVVDQLPKPLRGVNAGAGKWARQAYYNAEKGSAEGLVFLTNKGGAGSGVFDTTWGLSLSYASADGKQGSITPQTLADTLLEDNTEVAIFTSTLCTEGSCTGFSRPGTVAHEGFNGPSKLFLLEFSMPLSGTKGFNADMPAAWILNAQIPRTVQYADCSCWASGCGEWDIFEVLDSGNLKCKSTFHAGLGKGGGASEWFKRPVDKPIKVAVLFDGALDRGEGHIVVLPDDTVFDEIVGDESIVSMVQNIVGAKKNFVLGS